MAKITCGKCVFSEEDEPGSPLRQCRRYAPHQVADEESWYWPVVDEEDWCGEAVKKDG